MKKRIIVEVGHPAHVHFFKHMIWNLEKKGHELKICAIDKDVATDLLDAYGFNYKILGINREGNFISKIPMLINSEYNMLKAAKQFNPDLFISRLTIISAYISRIFKKPHISFSDTEHKGININNTLSIPFTDVICTPCGFRKHLGRKHVIYDGYPTIAYLHPKYFKPNAEVLDELNLKKDEKYAVLRFAAWSAIHDIGQKGFDLELKIKLVKELEKYAKVFITSESKLDKNLEKYKLTISPEKIHDLLYYATLFVGDSQGMTAESAALGVPAVRCNSFVGHPRDLGFLVELENKYGLIYSIRDPIEALNKSLELIKTPDIKQQWARKREKLLNEKIDVTKFMTWFLENYPESFYKMKESPSIQKKFA